MLAKLKPMLVRHEGLKLKVYKCTASRWTIGVGRNVEDTGITKDEAMLLLENDIRRIHGELKRLFPWFPLLNENRQIALIDMAFMGPEKLLGFTEMIEAIKRQDWTKAAQEMLDSKWAKDVKSGRANELASIMKTGMLP